MERQNSCRETTKMDASVTIEEARCLARKIVEHERGKCGGDVDLALHRAASLYGVEESSLRSLRYRARSLKFVKAHILERLRQIDGWLEERARQEREVLQRTAETLERSGSSAAGLARAAADLVREEAE